MMPMEWGARQDDTITVVGAAEVRARANLMHIMLEIRTRAATATEALQENNLRERAVRRLLQQAAAQNSLDIHEESIETSGVTFLPAAGDGVALPGSTEPQGFVAVRSLGINCYIADEEMNALPARIARILDEAAEGCAQAGSRHQVNLAIFRSPCVTFGLDNDEAPRAEALRKALMAARTAADEVARSTGAELEEIVSTQILELGALVQGRWAATAFGVPGLEIPRPPEAGRVPVRAVVSVTFRSRRLTRRPERQRLEAGRFTLESAESTPSSHTDAAELS